MTHVIRGGTYKGVDTGFLEQGHELALANIELPKIVTKQLEECINK